MKLPVVRRFRPKDLAYVRIQGRRHYLGPWGSEGVDARYRELIWSKLRVRVNDVPKADLGPPRPKVLEVATMSDLLAFHEAWAMGVMLKRGEPTAAALRIGCARRVMDRLKFGQVPIYDADTRWLTELQAALADSRELNYTRTTVNEYVRVIVAAAKFAYSQGMITRELWDRLGAVPGLRKNRPPAPGMRPAREPRRVEPPPRAWVRRVRRELPPHPRIMLDLQMVTAMRPSEVCAMRPQDLAPVRGQDGVMVYRVAPEWNKTDHDEHAHEKLVFLGPRAMRLLRMVWPEDSSKHFFRPKDSTRVYRSLNRKARKTPRFPSHDLKLRRDKRRAAGAVPPVLGDCYTADSYRCALVRACNRARRKDKAKGVPAADLCGVFTPYQLRHLRATHLAERAGLFVAQQMLGHKDPRTTLRYVSPREQFMAKQAKLLG